MKKRRINTKNLDRAFIRIYKEDALRENDMECSYCFRKMRYRESTVEHKISKANGGSNHRDNIGASCERCNSRKGKSNHKDFIKEINKPKIQPFSDLNFISLWIDRRINRAVNDSIERIRKVAR
jgi:methionyl-tRNA synthetase